MTVWIGTSGWQYAHWKNRFYPRETSQAGWLEFFAERFATVESNNAFYRLPERKTFEAWRARTPDDFRMAVKLSRYLTHIRRLREPAEPVERFVQRATGLGDKLGPVLIQLPPSLQSDVPRLAATLEQFPPGIGVAVEFRHETWYTTEVQRLLERHNAALCLAARRGVLTPLWDTADFGYVRFHEDRAAPRPCYGRRSMEAWAERLVGTYGAGKNLYVYFNNDPLACALRDATLFARACLRRGLTPTRVPPGTDVTVG